MNVTGKKAVELAKKGAIILDVRTGIEYKMGHIENSVNVPVNKIGKLISDVVKDKKQDIILYCTTGSRTAFALTVLNNLGYTNVYDLGAAKNWPDGFVR